MTWMRRLAVVGACLLGVGVGLAACSSQPAVCEDMDALRTSVGSLQDVTIGENALSELSTDLDQIESDLSRLNEDASEEYSSEVEAVRTRTAALRSSLQSASTDPTAPGWTEVANDVRALGSAVTDLGNAIGETCE